MLKNEIAYLIYDASLKLHVTKTLTHDYGNVIKQTTR